MTEKRKHPHADVAGGLAAMGRFGDDELIHVNKHELAWLDSITPGGLTTNPLTGKKEAWVWWVWPIVNGLATWAATGDAEAGLKSGALSLGLGAFGAAGGAAGAGANAGSTAATAANTGKTAATVANAGKSAAAAANVAKMAQAGVTTAQAAQGIDAIGTAAKGADAASSPGMIGSALSYMQENPMQTAMLASMLFPAGGPGSEDEDSEGQRFSDEYQTADRNTIPFSGQPSPGPSTYTRNEIFTTDDPYRYGQYEGEKLFFDNPGLKRREDGGIPDLPAKGKTSSTANLPPSLRPPQRRSAGGLLHGPGDGQSDEIQARGPQGDILLSGGEFVIPADVVAALGAGSTDAGSKRLYSAMDQIRMQSFGSKKQAKRPERVSI